MEMGLSARGHFTGDPAADNETDMVPDGSDELFEEDEWVIIMTAPFTGKEK